MVAKFATLPKQPVKKITPSRISAMLLLKILKGVCTALFFLTDAQ